MGTRSPNSAHFHYLPSPSQKLTIYPLRTVINSLAEIDSTPQHEGRVGEDPTGRKADGKTTVPGSGYEPPTQTV